ncbi:thiamine-phosphate kinase [Corynebacterium mendelii]|uniref:Thiamine-monophosphate kinase n=1 Tax=Corynebacterium mendelii TaxID=2765362 RepID=A0A939IXL7_9CORY|nr:thiamine-phosphate kinase [Corynebacterium mendelii]MBN9644600.1 thiamine-phosphate kinase [Corynebacterium mendelii]
MTTTVFPDRYRGMPVSQAGERATIEAITRVAPSAINGDDAAVLDPPNPNSLTVVTTDALVAGRHFRLDWSSAEDIGAKAVVQNAADIEAMGARPHALLLAMTLPGHTPLDFVTGVARGIRRRLDFYHMELVGGDVTMGDTLMLAMTATGRLTGPLPATRLDAAEAGQQILASGKLGWSAAGMALLEHFGPGDVPEEFLPLIGQHLSPEPAPGRGMVARAAGATAMTDNSDGLVHDLTVIAQRSRVRLDLDPHAIAPDDLLLRAARLLDRDPWEWVLTGGEDHTLLALSGSVPVTGFRVIGTCRRQGRYPVTVGGRVPRHTGGWESFGAV